MWKTFKKRAQSWNFGGGLPVIQSRRDRDPPTVMGDPAGGGGILIQRLLGWSRPEPADRREPDAAPSAAG
jgi:hypothetical protein